MKYHYIAVEGPIGVGKTSLVNLLSPKMNSIKVLEETENPFLKDFYLDREGSAFQTQLFFLLNRYRQQQELLQQDLFNRVTLCDYLFAKDKIFAYLNLNDSELLIYEKLYKMLEENVPQPDLVIYLQATVDVLMERIHKRKRHIEMSISEEYIGEVTKAFNYFFFHYTATPLLVINTSEIDFVEREEELDDLISEIEKMEKGTKYYVPLGSQKGPGREEE
jgi:deoxyguanosine kinase